jgi:hypothetical protein
MSKITRSMWIVIGGTLATLLGTLFLDWYSVTVHAGPFSASASVGAWDVNGLGKLAVLGSLVMLAGLALMFMPQPPALPVPLPTAMLIASAFTALMVVLELIDHHSYTAIGLYLSLVGALAAAYGAFEMGGRFSMSGGPAA